MDQARLLVADDEEEIRSSYARILTEAGHEVDTAANGDEVLEKVAQTSFDLLLTDLMFPPTDGISVLKSCKRVRPSTLVVVFTGFASVENVLSAFRAGAYDVLQKPVPRATLLELGQRALEIRRQGEKRRRLAEDLEHERLKVMHLRTQLALDDPFQRIIGTSPMVQRLVETIREVARTDSTVLLTGESGTGKGLVARTIHDASARSNGPFVEANCVVYSEGVLHSELFGHERGAFTGAARTKRGRFELAQGGTLFLDEIGEIPPATQLLMLRVLQERSFERVGGEQTLEVDVRLIAATNRELQDAIRQGTFRSDLYYRLNVIPLHLPPLREHPEDIPVLAQSLLAKCAHRMGRESEGFTEEALEVLSRYDWPGNVRELENLVERTVVLHRAPRIEVEDLPLQLRQAVRGVVVSGAPGSLQALERLRIIEALAEAGGNKKLAAKRLGIHRSTLYAKMRRYQLQARHGPSGNGGSRNEQQRESESATVHAGPSRSST